MKFKSQQKHLIIVFLLIVVILVFLKGYVNEKKKIYILSSSENDILINSNFLDMPPPENKNVTIYIEGSIQNPGVYELPLDSRVNDAVNLAGGLLEDADRKRINLAKKITDEEFIYVLAINEEFHYIEATNSSENSHGLININSASKQELESLVGIGPALAERIINYRNEKGKFNSIEELLDVNGIGENKYKDIEKSVTIK